MRCQRCRAPLRLDSSLDELSQSALNLLLDATSATSLQEPPQDVLKALQPLQSTSQNHLLDRAVQESSGPLIERGSVNTQALPKLPDNRADMSFIMLTESQVINSGARTSKPPASAPTKADKSSEGLQRAVRLFEVLSARTDIDHPICTDCTDALVQGMEKKLTAITKERNNYSEFLRRARLDTPSSDEQAALEKELASSKEQERQALKKLETVEAEHASLEKQLEVLEEESRLLDQEEEAFWRERNSFSQTLKEHQDERDSINMRYLHDSSLLERLQRTNVFNDTFCISHDGYFGTINGLRLGRMSGSSVEWAEVNAAWGQACLLLVTVAEKLNFTFQGYQLNAIGSTSTVDKIEVPRPGDLQAAGRSKTAVTTSLPLYYSSDLPLSIGFLHRHFDAAMVALLECIRQLGKHVEKTTQGTHSGGEVGLRLPYEIKKDRINDCSIRLGGFGQDDQWTKACKYTLTCCKFLLAHASNISGARKS